MRKAAIFGLGGGAVALLAFGVWLGSQRAADASSERSHGTAQQRDVTTHARVEPSAVRARPAVATRQAAPGLAIDLVDPDPRVRRNAIAELAASNSPDATVLLAGSRDANLDVALAATEGLGVMYRNGQLSAAELIARITDRNVPAKVRVTAINGLGLVASPESATALVYLVARGDEIDRRSAAILLVHQDATSAVPALIGALSDSDAIVRSNALESLRVLARGRDFGEDAGAWQRWWQSRTG